MRVSCIHSWNGGVVPSNTVGCGNRAWGSMTGSGAATAAPAAGAAAPPSAGGGCGGAALPAAPIIRM